MHVINLTENIYTHHKDPNTSQHITIYEYILQ